MFFTNTRHHFQIITININLSLAGDSTNPMSKLYYYYQYATHNRCY